MKQGSLHYASNNSSTSGDGLFHWEKEKGSAIDMGHETLSRKASPLRKSMKVQVTEPGGAPDRR